VTGLFMDLRHSDPELNKGKEQAQNAADSLEIRLITADMKEKFRNSVVDRFVNEYMAGRTPNPCVICNRDVKFSLLRERAENMHMDYIATGHYARIHYRTETDAFELHSGLDRKKDQSYFLFCLDRKTLSRTLFPLGEMKKKEVQELARRKGIPVNPRQESQDVCFVSSGHYGEFIAKSLGAKDPGEGPIFDKSGRLLGKHKGFYRYTLGQRKGLAVAAKEPLYVIKICPRQNALVLGSKKETLSDKILVDQVHWINNEIPAPDHEVQVKIRYNTPPCPARVQIPSPGQAVINLQKQLPAVTPGQAAVIYRNSKVLGGGWIKKHNQSE